LALLLTGTGVVAVATGASADLLFGKIAVEDVVVDGVLVVVLVVAVEGVGEGDLAVVVVPLAADGVVKGEDDMGVDATVRFKVLLEDSSLLSRGATTAPEEDFEMAEEVAAAIEEDVEAFASLAARSSADRFIGGNLFILQCQDRPKRETNAVSRDGNELEITSLLVVVPMSEPSVQLLNSIVC